MLRSTSTEQLSAIKNFLRQTSRHDGKPVDQIRREMDAAASAIPLLPATRVQQTAIGGLQGEWVCTGTGETCPDKENRVILYFYGGGFTSGSCAMYRGLAGRLSEASGVKVLTVQYRLAPEHTYPAANDDCLSAYRWLIANGYPAQNIVFGGDSVGGSLALMTLLSLRDAGEALPAGAFLLSPHTDLIHLDGESYHSRAELDPTSSQQGNRAIADTYLGDWPGEPPALLSPLRMELSGLPELFIQAGDHEVLLSDAARLAERATKAGVQVSLEVWDDMWSVFQFMAHMLPEARQAIENIGRFVRSALKLPPGDGAIE